MYDNEFRLIILLIGFFIIFFIIFSSKNNRKYKVYKTKNYDIKKPIEIRSNKQLDLDKKRILRAIETEMMAKGFVKSDNPSMLVSIFTTAEERVDVYNNFGWGWGAWGPWGPWGGGFGNTVSRTTEGTLYIDLIDATKKELVWQGQGTGYLARNVERKQERINEIVGEIMQEYPPKQMASN